jgi:hypothetical protein
MFQLRVDGRNKIPMNKTVCMHSSSLTWLRHLQVMVTDEGFMTKMLNLSVR